MPFKGQLHRGVPVTVSVTAGANNASSTGITLQKMVRIARDTQIFEVDAITVAPGANGELAYAFGNNVTRVVFDVQPPTGGNAVVRVTQGLTLFEDPVMGDMSFVYNVVP